MPVIDYIFKSYRNFEPQFHSSLLENMKQFILELGKEDFLYIEDEYCEFLKKQYNK